MKELGLSLHKIKNTALFAGRASFKVAAVLLNLFVILGLGASAQTSFWTKAAAPVTPEANDPASVTLGLNFYSDVAGYVTGVRFYKGSNNTGTHVGTLWTAAGAQLATVTFSGETTSGWQQANFATPVSIAAKTTYVISYLAPQGWYADDQSYSWSSLSATPLHVSGSSPGVYAYGANPTFPNGTWNSSNYWVDLVFTQSATTQGVAGTITGGAGAAVSLSGSTTVTTTASSSGAYTFSGVANGTYTVTPSKAGFAFTPLNRLVTVSGANITGVNFTAAAADSIWPSSASPLVADEADSSSVTLGLNFYSDVAGTVTGVRFYKSAANTGTHVGSLWTASGTQLATVTFTDETASGWQEASFSSPVTIAPNTTYVISYLAPNGWYADDQNYSWAGVSAAPLHVSGSSPGVYSYGASPTFPNSAWNASNYWVDLVFVPSSSTSTPPPTAYGISGTVSGSSATLTLSGTSSGSTTTGSGGTYSFSGLANGSYVVAPSETGYTFSPATASVTVNGTTVTGVNFTATKLESHSVSLSWVASVSPNIAGYNVYRGTATGGPFTKLNSSLLTNLSYTDSNVTSGQTYYYVTTAVNTSNVESGDSNEAAAAVPTP